MLIDVMTLFPEMFESPLEYSILKRARETEAVEIVLSNIRDYAADKYKKVDDKPYGGGAGMVMMCQPIFDCFEDITKETKTKPEVIMLTPQGEKFNQEIARQLSRQQHLVLIAGRYEGIDERVREGLGARQLSIGDYVLTGGELPALVVIDAVARLLDGVLGDSRSSEDESFSEGLLEYPHYTRPEVYRGMKVPDILLSGHHKNIQQWRNRQSLERTKRWRPDLLDEHQKRNE